LLTLAAALGGALLATGCASAPPPLDLGKELSLSIVELPPVFEPGQRVRMTFAVQNHSNREIQLCGDGVTTHLIATSPLQVWVLAFHPRTLDTDCSGPFTLPAGGDQLFIDEALVNPKASPGNFRLFGTIGLDCQPTWAQRACVSTTLKFERNVTVGQGPSP
jgi:hypothetical protein